MMDNAIGMELLYDQKKWFHRFIVQYFEQFEATKCCCHQTRSLFLHVSPHFVLFYGALLILSYNSSEQDHNFHNSKRILLPWEGLECKKKKMK